MEFNSGVSMFLPDSIGLLDNDYDEEDQEDMVHEQTNQNEVSQTWQKDTLLIGECFVP